MPFYREKHVKELRFSVNYFDSISFFRSRYCFNQFSECVKKKLKKSLDRISCQTFARMPVDKYDNYMFIKCFLQFF